MADNTNKDSLGQILLGSHRIPYRGNTAAERKHRAQLKMMDMTPAQKAAELARLKAKYEKVSDLPPKRAKNVKVGKME